jgi:L-threonylcarbamoyladenylate synthase
MTSDPVRDAANWIRQGGVVVFPTETFYGLAADPTSSDAVAAIIEIKGRSAGLALPLVAASVAQVERFVGPLSGTNARLAAEFWPGPLSLVFDAPAAVVPAVHAGTNTIAIRVPSHPTARALAEVCGHPLTATSANQSGEPALQDVGGFAAFSADRRVFVLDGGRTPGGAPSTIVDARATPVRILRHGAVPEDRVLRSIHE